MPEGTTFTRLKTTPAVASKAPSPSSAGPQAQLWRGEQNQRHQPAEQDSARSRPLLGPPTPGELPADDQVADAHRLVDEQRDEGDLAHGGELRDPQLAAVGLGDPHLDQHHQRRCPPRSTRGRRRSA